MTIQIEQVRSYRFQKDLLFYDVTRDAEISERDFEILFGLTATQENYHKIEQAILANNSRKFKKLIAVAEKSRTQHVCELFAEQTRDWGEYGSVFTEDGEFDFKNLEVDSADAENIKTLAEGLLQALSKEFEFSNPEQAFSFLCRLLFELCKRQNQGNFTTDLETLAQLIFREDNHTRLPNPHILEDDFTKIQNGYVDYQLGEFHPFRLRLQSLGHYMADDEPFLPVRVVTSGYNRLELRLMISRKEWRAFRQVARDLQNLRPQDYASINRFKIHHYNPRRIYPQNKFFHFEGNVADRYYPFSSHIKKPRGGYRDGASFNPKDFIITLDYPFSAPYPYGPKVFAPYAESWQEEGQSGIYDYLFEYMAHEIGHAYYELHPEKGEEYQAFISDDFIESQNVYYQVNLVGILRTKIYTKEKLVEQYFCEDYAEFLKSKGTRVVERVGYQEDFESGSVLKDLPNYDARLAWFQENIKLGYESL